MVGRFAVSPKNFVIVLRVALINTYLQGREVLVSAGGYPAHHLWGVDHLPSEKFQVVIVASSGEGFVNCVGRWFSRVTRYRFGDLDQEWEIWKRRKDMDIAYVANGNLFLVLILRTLGLFKPRIVRWTYTPRTRFPWWTLRDLNLGWVNRGTDVLLCLTRRAAEAYRSEMPFLQVIQMDWGADMTQFRPGRREGGFFFACGKTNRDYGPVLKAAPGIPAPIHLIVHRGFLDGHDIAANVHLESGSPDGMTDRGISYPELLCQFFHCGLAVLIPLKPIQDDTAGMTNLLEAMACGLPVVMTRTGAIDLDIESEGIGIYVKPDDASGWAKACRDLLQDPDKSREMGDRARKLVEEHYNTERLAEDLAKIFVEIIAQPMKSKERQRPT
jgi:glycosyltransferase involved in cell wall biosynthesis